MHRIFVYGTLLPGERNHAELRNARSLGRARTLPQWELVDLGRFPGIRAGSDAIEGEVFEVDEHHLAALDAFEGDWFVRREVALEDGVAEAWVLAKSVRGRRIASGRYRR